MLEAIELTKNYGAKRVVDEVSFRVEPGQILGFLGNNGAGKSTTMKMVTGFLQPTSGSAKIEGFDIRTHSLQARRKLGYLPEGVPLYPEMTVEVFLGFVAEVRGYDGADRAKRVDSTIDTCILQDVRRQSIDTLSKGFRQRVGLAQAVLHDPQVLIMDEPTDGLDPNQKHVVRNLIKTMGEDKTIILSTHILEEVEEVCTRAIIISRGKLIVDDTPKGLKQQSTYHNALSFTIAGTVDELTAADASQRLDAFEPAARWERLDREQANSFSARLFPAGDAISTADFHQLVSDAGWTLASFRVEEGRLDEVFRKLTHHEPDDTQHAPA